MLARGTEEKVPSRRVCETYSLKIASPGHGTIHAHVTFGRYPDGRLAEVFAAVSKTGSAFRTALETWGMTSSKALQAGMPVRDLAHSVRGVQDTSAGTVTSPPELKGCDVTSVWDAIGLLLERFS